MFIGLDIGTSSVKAMLVDGEQEVVAEATAGLSVERPQPLWSEQDPASWVEASKLAIAGLRSEAPSAFASVEALGLSGQMHGATLLDASDNVLRPAILWNDGRSEAQCRELAERVENLEDITGNLAMAGFTAPKLLWVAQHEPEIFSRLARVLLPKDYVRLALTGEFASDMSDSAGTLWLDVEARRWSTPMLDACEMSEAQMPGLYEGSDATGILRASVAEELGLPAGVVVAAGAGDNAAGAIGLGVLDPGQAFVSLGTSGVYFVANDGYAPNTKGGVHTFCHALPKRYHQMGVLLSAASALQWLSGLLGVSEAELLAELDASLQTSGFPADGPLFLPYLSGERTPHNDPNAQGVFFGLTHESGRPELTLAVLEGVAFAFADAQQSLLAAGSKLDQVAVIGGGARSPLWGRVLASALDRPLTYREGAELGAAFGAARLGRLALTGESPQDVCTPGAVREVIEPDPVLVDRAAARLPRFRDLYARLKDAWSPAR